MREVALESYSIAARRGAKDEARVERGEKAAILRHDMIIQQIAKLIPCETMCARRIGTHKMV